MQHACPSYIDSTLCEQRRRWVRLFPPSCLRFKFVKGQLCIYTCET